MEARRPTFPQYRPGERQDPRRDSMSAYRICRIRLYARRCRHDIMLAQRR